jgi:hypothetical protein
LKKKCKACALKKKAKEALKAPATIVNLSSVDDEPVEDEETTTEDPVDVPASEDQDHQEEDTE